MPGKDFTAEEIQDHTDAFFPERGQSTREAKTICLGCAVVANCLEHALNIDVKFGIWGAMSERERRRLRGVRKRQGEAAMWQLGQQMLVKSALRHGVNRTSFKLK